jgi:hypothetical protein
LEDLCKWNKLFTFAPVISGPDVVTALREDAKSVGVVVRASAPTSFAAFASLLIGGISAFLTQHTQIMLGTYNGQYR